MIIFETLVQSFYGGLPLVKNFEGRGHREQLRYSTLNIQIEKKRSCCISGFYIFPLL